jgi:hypothetical protein
VVFFLARKTLDCSVVDLMAPKKKTAEFLKLEKKVKELEGKLEQAVGVNDAVPVVAAVLNGGQGGADLPGASSAYQAAEATRAAMAPQFKNAMNSPNPTKSSLTPGELKVRNFVEKGVYNVEALCLLNLEKLSQNEPLRQWVWSTMKIKGDVSVMLARIAEAQVPVWNSGWDQDSLDEFKKTFAEPPKAVEQPTGEKLAQSSEVAKLNSEALAKVLSMNANAASVDVTDNFELKLKVEKPLVAKCKTNFALDQRTLVKGSAPYASEITGTMEVAHLLDVVNNTEGAVGDIRVHTEGKYNVYTISAGSAEDDRQPIQRCLGPPHAPAHGVGNREVRASPRRKGGRGLLWWWVQGCGDDALRARGPSCLPSRRSWCLDGRSRGAHMRHRHGGVDEGAGL